MGAFWHWLVVNDLYHDVVADLTVGVFALTLSPLIRRINRRLKRVIVIWHKRDDDDKADPGIPSGS